MRKRAAKKNNRGKGDEENKAQPKKVEQIISWNMNYICVIYRVYSIYEYELYLCFI